MASPPPSIYSSFSVPVWGQPSSASSELPRLSVRHTKEGLKVYLNRQEIKGIQNINIDHADNFSNVTIKLIVQMENYTPPNTIMDVMRQNVEDEKSK